MEHLRHPVHNDHVNHQGKGSSTKRGSAILHPPLSTTDVINEEERNFDKCKVQMGINVTLRYYPG